MMCCRMVSHGKKAKEYLGDEFASPYFSIVRLVVETAVPLGLSGIAYLVVFGVRSPMAVTFLRVYVLMMVRPASWSFMGLQVLNGFVSVCGRRG